jgi:hypothetical protein
MLLYAVLLFLLLGPFKVPRAQQCLFNKPSITIIIVTITIISGPFCSIAGALGPLWLIRLWMGQV